MTNYTLIGDFSFDSHNISSTDGFCVTIDISLPRATKNQHIYIRDQISSLLCLTKHEVPTAWGDNPPHYENIRFDTNIHDADAPRGLKTGDLPLIKHLVGLLKEAREAGVMAACNGLTCNGYNYPKDTDHPLFAKIEPLSPVPDGLRDFSSFNNTIERVIDEAQKRFPDTIENKDRHAANESFQRRTDYGRPVKKLPCNQLHRNDKP